MHHRDVKRIKWAHIPISWEQGLSQRMCSTMLVNIHIAFSWRVPVSRQWIDSLTGKSWHSLGRDWIDRWLILCFHIDHIWNIKRQLKALSDVTAWDVFSYSVTLCCIWMWTWTAKKKMSRKPAQRILQPVCLSLALSLSLCLCLSVSGSALSPHSLPPTPWKQQVLSFRMLESDVEWLIWVILFVNCELLCLHFLFTPCSWQCLICLLY